MSRDTVTTAKRPQAIVAPFNTGKVDVTEIFGAFAELDALSEELVQSELGAWLGPVPNLDAMDNRERRAQGLPLRPLRLTAVSVATDADVLDLGPIAEEQLRLAGKSWDGQDLAPEDRLDGELEGSFAGTLERRVLADADAKRNTPLFDVLLFADDAGIVFEAGTTRQVALIAYRKVEMKDGRTRRAIEDAIGVPAVPSSVAPPAAASAPSMPALVVGEKSAEKNALRKAPAVKKVSAKKSALKKAPAVKKAAAPKAPKVKAASKKAPSAATKAKGSAEKASPKAPKSKAAGAKPKKKATSRAG
ncbi:MAG: hypothetical protein IPG50_31635 [Myxococcales bacterium]|nr:hypothetical protein [Myxococcales bacterium]